VLFVAVARLDDDATCHDIFPLTDRLWMFPRTSWTHGLLRDGAFQ
jgi:hypothetical protein